MRKYYGIVESEVIDIMNLLIEYRVCLCGCGFMSPCRLFIPVMEEGISSIHNSQSYQYAQHTTHMYLSSMINLAAITNTILLVFIGL